MCVLTTISGNAALNSSRNILTPPSTPRHTHERQALRELRTAAELSPRRRRVPNPFTQIPRASSNENIPPSGRSAARAAGQKRRRDRERRERGENTTLPVQRSVTRSLGQQTRRRREREEDDERHMDIDRALSLSPRISSPLNRGLQRPRTTALPSRLDQWEMMTVRRNDPIVLASCRCDTLHRAPSDLDTSLDPAKRCSHSPSHATSRRKQW